ncbi:MAG: HzsA-related protein, partial [Planctomycetota bacterium]
WFFRTGTGKYIRNKNGQGGHLYTHPYPVSDRQFLVSYKDKPSDHYKNVPNAYSLRLIDVDGGNRMVLNDEKLSLWHPLPIVPRKVPPLLQIARAPSYKGGDHAVCILANVYQGMEGVKRGDVKWLRINEAISRYWSTGRRWGPANSSSSWKGSLWPRVQWGVVPVEADGSAYFKVPANRNIFYQVLDKDFREIQRERTYVNYKPGEVRSCSGCHGQATRVAAVVDRGTPLALKRAPSEPGPQPCDLVKNGGTGKAGQVIHYPTDIQPIFNAKCVKCHNSKKADGGLKLTGEVTQFYNTSYEALARKQLAGPIIPEFTSFRQGDRGNYNGAVLPPKQLGSYRSPLIGILTDPKHAKNKKDDHSKMLTAMEVMRVSRWVDANYQFYGSYYGRQHPRWQKADSRKPAYKPEDFRREASFEEAVSMVAPDWHR